jgi:signal transduction histidine kinase
VGALTRRVALASSALVVLIAGAFLVLLLALDSMRDSGAVAQHSRTELGAANGLEKLVIDAEAGHRGFVITHQERFLEPWRAARRDIPESGRRLLALADAPRQRRRAAEIVRAVESYLHSYSLPLVAAARRGDPSAESASATLRGKRLVDDLRSRFDTYVETERSLLTAGQAEADADAHRATLAATVGLVGSILLVVLFASYLARAIVLPIRRAAGMARRLAGGDLSVRMPETGPGEVGMLEGSLNTMAASLEDSQAKLQRFADEQAALRRVATLVAHDVPPDELLESVVREVTGVIGSDSTGLLRYEEVGVVTLLASWTAGNAGRWPLGRFTPPGGGLTGQIRSTGRPAWMYLDESLEGYAGRMYKDAGIRSVLGVPIFVSGHVWGVIATAWASEGPRPEGIEERMSQFTELVATAVANAESRAEVSASRARVVAAADETRRRIERNLHDGTQQRLVSLGLELRAAEALASQDQTELRAQLSNAMESLTGALEELQEISRGIHPASLSRGGLAPALKALARRSSVPVELSLDLGSRLPGRVEVATYYVVSEALANAAKHAGASGVWVDAVTEDGVVRVSIADDGVGGADPSAGSGLVGLRDRVEALGGELSISSAPGEGTALEATIPIPHQE